jgi:hypothetical protein
MFRLSCDKSLYNDFAVLQDAVPQEMAQGDETPPAGHASGITVKMKLGGFYP